jgi:hypothetical protein
MNFEGLEQMRYETTKQVMEAMAVIAADPKAPIEERLKAAKIVDSMSDSIIKAYLLSQELGAVEKTTGKLSKQLDKLTEKDNDI